MGLDLEYTDGQTPIDEEEKEGLLIETISTKAELDEFDKPKQVFTENFICNLHKRMYGPNTVKIFS